MTQVHRRWRTHLIAAALAAAVVSAGLLVSCERVGSAAGPSPASRAYVFTQVPAGRLPAMADPASFRDPYPDGSRIVSLGAAESTPTNLTPTLAAAGDPAVSPDGRMLLFSGKPAGGAWGIYDMPVAGGEPRRITPHTFNAIHPAYLPDGRIIYSADAHGAIDPVDGSGAFSLYTAKLDGSAQTRITYNLGSDVEPVVQWSNRVLYATRQAAPQSPAGRWIIQGIRSDGTMASGYVGMDEEASYRRPAELPGRLIALVRSNESGDRAHTVSTARPLATLSAAVPMASAVRSVAPAGERMVASIKPDGADTFAIALVGPDDSAAAKLVFDDPAYDDIDPCHVHPTSPPRGFISMLKPDAPGQLLCLDARRTSGAGRRERTVPAAALRVYRGKPAPSAGDPPVEELLAEVPLASDGSVFMKEVPADTPLRFETIDASGQTLVKSHTWVWVRPGEIRGCIGCHENPESAPANRMPDAVVGKASSAAPLTPGGM